MNKMMRVIGMAVVVAALIFGGKLWLEDYISSHKEVQVIEKEKETIIEVKEEISAEMIKEGLEDIGELATEEYSFTEVATYSEASTVKGYEIPLTKTSCIYSYDGMIKAGIDFTKISVTKDEENKVITLSIPPSQILSFEIYEDSFELYDETNSIFHPLSVSDVHETQEVLREKALESALAKGLLEKADENAKSMLLAFVKGSFALDGYRYEVEVVEEEEE